MKREICQKFGVILLLTMMPLLTWGMKPQVIPLSVDREQTLSYGVPLIEGRIQGKPVRLLFDMGHQQAGITLHPQCLANLTVKWLKHPACQRRDAHWVCEHRFVLPRLTLGPVTQNNIEGAVLTRLWHPATEAEASESPFLYDGVIGYSFISQFNVLIDYPDAELVLYKKGTLPAFIHQPQWIKLRFTGHLLTTLLLNKHAVKLRWDASYVPSQINARLLKTVKLAPCPKQAPYNRSGQCRRLKTRALATRQGQLLPATWFQLASQAPQAGVDGVIGANFFRSHQVFIDFERKHLYVRD